METAIVFPGMGPSRFQDVAKFLLINPVARRLTAEADAVLGYSLFDRYRDADEDYSEYAQVAFLVTCVALAEWARETGAADGQVCAGPSFGGKAAAVHSGALGFADAVRVTAGLVRCEEEYFSREHTDVVTHSFTRLSAELLDGVLAQLRDGGDWFEVSCYVDEDFHMVSLREERVEWFQQRLRALGGFPLYSMKPPLHCAAFAGLREKAEREVFAGVRFADPVLPVVADQDGAVLETAAGVRGMLLDGFVRPVRWPAVVATLTGLGVTRVVVAGPDAIFGRVGCTTRNFEVVALNPRMAMRPRPRSRATAAV